MNKLKPQIKNNIINKYKLIYIPLFIALASIFIVSISSYYISRYWLLEQIKQDGLLLANNVVYQTQKNKLSLDSVVNYLENDIRRAGQIVIRNQENLSNDFLKGLAKDLNVNEIDYYDNNAKIIYSNFDNYVGWMGEESHTSHSFKKSDKSELMEEVRENAITGELYKYGYIKSSKGGFVQVGILWDKVTQLQEKFSYQTLTKELTSAENVVYVTIVDKDLKIIANSHANNIGFIYDQRKHKGMQEAISGKVFTEESYYDKIDGNILEIYAPIAIDGKVVSGLVIGYSMAHAYNSIYMISISSFIIALLMFLLVIYIQNKNIIKPANELDHQIRQIDIEKNISYRLPLSEKGTFFGLSVSINNILDKTFSYFNQLTINQEKLTEAYQQLTASEEELRAQYDEIQSYTEKIEYLVDHDTLTDLPNRRKFLVKLEEEVRGERCGVVMMLDLDNFKGINDTLGHIYGDKVLKKVSEELERIKDDKMLISRFGGDEFLILIIGVNDINVVEDYANRIINLFKNNLFIEKDEIHIGCSIGITLYPMDSNEVYQLVMNADMAMYKVKGSGRNNYMFFNEKMTANLKEHIKTERILREAIKDNRFKLLYQPQINTFTGEIVGFEALLRLKDYFISPALFIPIAEDTGMIIEIGRWVTTEAIKQIAKWKKKGLDVKPIAINLSVKQLSDTNYIDFLQDTLKEEEVEAKFINIEITESIFLEKKEETLIFLSRLKELGIKIALDDFGTGYSSLNYLTFLPVDKIKLDKSLNDKFLELDNVKVMDNLISLAHSLKLDVVAEGIENVEQYKRLKVGKCNEIQGYLFSKPLEVVEAEKVYNDNFLEKLNLL